MSINHLILVALLCTQSLMAARALVLHPDPAQKNATLYTVEIGRLQYFGATAATDSMERYMLVVNNASCPLEARVHSAQTVCAILRAMGSSISLDAFSELADDLLLYGVTLADHLPLYSSVSVATVPIKTLPSQGGVITPSQPAGVNLTTQSTPSIKQLEFPLLMQQGEKETNGTLPHLLHNHHT